MKEVIASHSPAHCALVARVPRLIALRGGAGQRGVAVHAERVVVLVALLASPAGAAAEQVSEFPQRAQKYATRNVRESKRNAAKLGERFVRFMGDKVSAIWQFLLLPMCTCVCLFGYVCVCCAADNASL